MPLGPQPMALVFRSRWVVRRTGQRGNTVSVGDDGDTLGAGRAAPLPAPSRRMVFDGTPSLAATWLRHGVREVAHLGGSGLGGSSERLGCQRELLAVPQFDDSSVRFQPQALHGLSPNARIIADAR